MQLSRKWLNEFVTIEASDKEYAEAMTMSGSKVEAVTTPGSEITNVVVGLIEKIAPHPNADKLQVCQVNVGPLGHRQIVTAAKNIAEGDLVPVALDGSKLAGGLEIHSGALRGETSEGMFCSIAELGLTLHEVPYAIEDGILIIEEECAPGDDIHPIMGLDDHVVEFEITNNRPDCMNVIGLARETAATYNVPMRTHEPVVKAGGQDINELLKVEVRDTDLCPRYTARMVTDVNIAPSPRWMRERLSASGVRPINNIVDITNYVMLEYGQPMHAFDFACVEGDTIVVRRAGDDTEFTTLDDISRKLTPNMLMIADKNRPVGIAGVMGGLNSEITESTQCIVFESANFSALSVRATALALNMRTDASSRFDKGLDPAMTLEAVNRACELVEMLGAGKVCEGVIDIDNADHTPATLPLECERINALLGTDLTSDEMAVILERLNFKVENGVVTVPTWRSDIEHMADLAEEVARIYGYDKLPITSFKGETVMGGYTPRQLKKNEVGSLCRSLGYTEILTYSFISPASYDKLRLAEDDERRNYLEILNPLGKDTSSMRTSSLPSMMDTLQRNWAARNKEVKLYEIATVYKPGENRMAIEKSIVTLGCYGKGTDFYAIKGDIECMLAMLGIKNLSFEACTTENCYHPGRCAKVYCGESCVGIFGQIHPLTAAAYDIDTEVYTAELSFDAIFENGSEAVIEALPKYPGASRDLALICDRDIPVAKLQGCIKAAGGALLRQVEFFDVYTGTGVAEGKKSVAFSLMFRSDESSLRDDDVNSAIENILAALSAELGAVLR